jgi:hypothetical protein
MLDKQGVLDKSATRDIGSKIRVAFSRLKNAAEAAQAAPGTDNAKAQLAIIGSLLPQLEAMIPTLPDDAPAEAKTLAAEWGEYVVKAKDLAELAKAAANAVRASRPANYEDPRTSWAYQRDPRLPDVVTLVYCTDRKDARPVQVNDSTTIHPNKPIDLDQRTFRKAQGLFRQCVRVPEGLFKTKGATFLVTIEV